MILRAFERCFWEGCGLKLADVLQSSRLGLLKLKMKKLYDSFGPKSDRGIALKAGHLTMGRLLNTQPEKEALMTAKHTKSGFGHGTEMRPLIQILGEELVRAAGECLPASICNLAIEWRKADTDRQLEITKILFEEFISSGQLDPMKRELNWQVAQEDLWHHFEANNHDNNKVLPRRYGKWDKNTCIANCQGKTQMLTAFARMAHAKIMAVSPILQARGVIEKCRNLAIQMIEEDICLRNIYPDPTFKESIDAHKYMKIFDDMVVGDSFHICVALRLCDGRWVMIDPHSLNWGVFPEIWGLDKKYKLLKKYEEALPGLQIMSHDGGLYQTILGKKIEKTRELLAKSKELEDMIDNPADIMGVCKTLVDSGALNFILEKYQGKEAVFGPDIPRIIKEHAASILYLGTRDLFDSSILFEAISDKNFFKKRLGSLLTVYHHSAIEEVKDQLNMEGILLHPVCDFSLPEYHIAISAINSLCGREDGSENRFFLDYSFDQVTLFNALNERFVCMRPNDPEVAVAAAEVLKALPFIHSNSRRKL